MIEVMLAGQKEVLRRVFKKVEISFDETHSIFTVGTKVSIALSMSSAFSSLQWFQNFSPILKKFI